MSTALAPRANGHGTLTTLPSLGADHVIATMETTKAVRTFVQNEMKDGLDFGLIPGVAKKCLYKPGAEKVNLLFNCWPRHQIERIPVEFGGPSVGHMEVVVKTELISRATDEVIGEGSGSCSTMEGRYRYRKAGLVCPSCGQESVIRGKTEYGGGFICFAKKGGCGQKFRDNDAAITGQPQGQAENENVWDVRNTVLKMAVKRADVAAALSLGCLSEIFTQDVEDFKTFDIDGGNGDHGTHSEPDDRPTRHSVNEAFPSRERERERPQNNSGHASGQYASPEQREKYLEGLRGWIATQNAAWVDSWQNATGACTLDGRDLPKACVEPMNIHQVDSHLLKWCVETGRLDQRIVPEDTKVRQLGQYVAIVYFRDKREQQAIGQEMKRYAKEQFERRREDVYRKCPDLMAPEDRDDATTAAVPDAGGNPDYENGGD